MAVMAASSDEVLPPTYKRSTRTVTTYVVGSRHERHRDDLFLFPPPFVRIMLGIASSRQIAAQSHCNRPCCHFRQPSGHHDRRGGHRTGQAGGQSNGTVSPSDIPITMS